jgi:hypothetical protein
LSPRTEMSKFVLLALCVLGAVLAQEPLSYEGGVAYADNEVATQEMPEMPEMAFQQVEDSAAPKTPAPSAAKNVAPKAAKASKVVKAPKAAPKPSVKPTIVRKAAPKVAPKRKGALPPLPPMKPFKYHPERNTAPVQANVRGDDPEMFKLNQALEAVKEDILSTNKQIGDERKWVIAVNKIIVSYTDKMKRVEDHIIALRKEMKNLYKKKKQIENLKLQKALEAKLKEANEELATLTNSLKHVQVKQGELNKSGSDLKATIAGIKAQLAKLRGKPKAPAKAKKTKKAAKKATKKAKKNAKKNAKKANKKKVAKRR